MVGERESAGAIERETGGVVLACEGKEEETKTDFFLQGISETYSFTNVPVEEGLVSDDVLAAGVLALFVAVLILVPQRFRKYHHKQDYLEGCWKTSF